MITSFLLAASLITTPVTNGFYRVTQHDDGKWWVVDPAGQEIVLKGCDWVRYLGHGCFFEGGVYHYKEWNDAHYPDKAAWVKETAERLREWGFNTIGAGGDPEFRDYGFVRTIEMSVGNSFGKPNDWNDPRWICPAEGRPCSALPDMFHPDFPAFARKQAEKYCAPNREDRSVFGYFIDNELAWWGRGAGDTGLFDQVKKLGANRPSRIALERFVAEHGGKETKEVKVSFLEFAAEEYFRVTTDAIRSVDPNHLVLGCRFAGLWGADPVVWRAAGKYCDVLTFNCYPWADLNRNVVMLGSRGDSETLVKALSDRYQVAKKPMMVTEWSFPALDSGLPCTNGAGQRFATQEERARATELCARTFLGLDFLIGYDYFMWVDEPYKGISKSFPENTNYGLVSEKGVPYGPITEVFKRIQNDVPGVRAAGIPKETPGIELPNSAKFLGGRKLADSKVSIGTEDYKLQYANFELRGGFGAKRTDMFDQVLYSGKDYGRLGIRLELNDANGNRTWIGVDRVKSFRQTGNGIEITAVSDNPVWKCSVTCRFTPLADGSLHWDLIDVVNNASVAVEVVGVYFSPYASFSCNSKDRVPYLWHGGRRQASWQSAVDGSELGVWTLAPTMCLFEFFLMRDGTEAHPDAIMKPRIKTILGPNEKYNPQGDMWVVVFAK